MKQSLIKIKQAVPQFYEFLLSQFNSVQLSISGIQNSVSSFATDIFIPSWIKTSILFQFLPRTTVYRHILDKLPLKSVKLDYT